ncbi:hypothetical protein [Streptomyces iconiensis]|uniref:Secreted protein n=1 Tax=Streptomyces iconiensis TaxID=1384038 RepID=A0ABT7A769_9ACTN|nr:hypothetical protein [Streptomyces iconiensis]MDJ1137182.1 hypothetical protein [Streptomyces iconiensis]
MKRTTTDRRRSRHVRAAALAAATAAAALVAGSTTATASAAAPSATASASAGAEVAPAGKAVEEERIATTTLGDDYKLALTALRDTGDPYAASVRLTVYGHTSGAWKETDRVTIGETGGWFWYPLTGNGAVCRFTAGSTNPAPIEVSLTVTPSIGCSPTEHFTLKDGRVYGQP